MDNKSPDAFRTISEVAEDLDLPQHVLRFWETRFSQIKPMKRGGGRRYYRPDDIELLKGIRILLYDQGYTIKGVQKLLKQNGNKFVIAIGSGDLAAAEALSASMSEEMPSPPKQASEEDQLVGRAKPPSTRRFFGLGGDSGKPGADAQENGGGGLKRDDRALLQEALYDLLECKRLLDQVR
ncbi:MerR-like DNA binding protein [Hoeflea halophila]|uniref:MerR-like DNA binding protein n=1 Tax=Hoeflea halophila TaxID=714899 RepID=A0A286IB62_9HYPH|nr:MerR family transcriptional regulator [Hoeflea halophila]SOE17340.1 MerR-like DNA binding protein [Hoeflea halophila]